MFVFLVLNLLSSARNSKVVRSARMVQSSEIHRVLRRPQYIWPEFFKQFTRSRKPQSIVVDIHLVGYKVFCGSRRTEYQTRVYLEQTYWYCTKYGTVFAIAGKTQYLLFIHSVRLRDAARGRNFTRVSHSVCKCRCECTLERVSAADLSVSGDVCCAPVINRL